MDRLVEFPRSTPTQRPEANDFTRPKSTRSDRAERRDEVEARSDDKVEERERPERASDRPERFSVHLEEQKASLEPQGVLDATPESDTQVKPEVEKAGAEARPDANPGRTSSSTTTTATTEGSPELTLEAAAPEIPAALAGVTKPDQKQAQATTTTPTILPTAVPVLTVETVPTITAKSSELEPAIAAAPRVDGDKKSLDVELAATKPGGAHSEASAHAAPTSNAKAEIPVETPALEAPRESPAARSAQEVERAADILRQIRVQITPQLSEARIQLHPIELGRISIHLSVEDGRVKTTVHAERRETLQAIQTHLPELRASLRQQGIDAQEFQLSLGFENNGGRDAERAQRRPNARTEAADVAAIERSPALHAALAKTGVDFYA